MEESMSMSRTQLLEEESKAFEALASLLASLNPEQMITGGVNGSWSTKDILAHITAWHIHLLNLMEGVKLGQEPVLNHDENKELDDINEQFYQQGQTRPLDEVLRDFHSTRLRVVEQLQQLSDEQLRTPPWSGSTSPLSEFVAGNTFEHYAEHMQPIEAWLASTDKG
jgi:hypothetical protein